jgi:general stress protein CsbA
MKSILKAVAASVIILTMVLLFYSVSEGWIDDHWIIRIGGLFMLLFYILFGTNLYPKKKDH